MKHTCLKSLIHLCDTEMRVIFVIYMIDTFDNEQIKHTCTISLIHLCDTKMGVIYIIDTCDIGNRWTYMHMWFGDGSHLCDMDRNCCWFIYVIRRWEWYVLLIHVILGTDKTYMHKIVDSSMWYKDGIHLSNVYHRYMWYWEHINILI